MTTRLTLSLLCLAIALPGATAQTPTQILNLGRCGGMALGVNGALNGFVPSPDDAWHQDISNAAVDPSSNKIVNTDTDIGYYHLHPDFGSSFGIPYNVVDSLGHPEKPVTITLYKNESDILKAPVEDGLVIEGRPAACTPARGDQHLLLLDRHTCTLYEYWQASACNGKFSAANSAFWDMTTTEHRPYTYTSADAAGLSVFEGLIRYDEIVAGHIDHAIRFTAKFTKNNANNGYFVAPATHAAGTNWSTDNIIGMRIRLKASYDISQFSKTNQIILTAMKKYGMILADNGSTLYFQGTQDNRWDDNDLNNLKQVPASAFEVIQMGTIYDAASAPKGAAPVIKSFTASATTVKAGTPVILTPVVTGASYSYIDSKRFTRKPLVTVKPKKTTTYTLTSRNAYGSASASVTITVIP